MWARGPALILRVVAQRLRLLVHAAVAIMRPRLLEYCVRVVCACVRERERALDLQETKYGQEKKKPC